MSLISKTISKRVLEDRKAVLSSENLTDMGAISREDLIYYYQEPSETIRLEDKITKTMNLDPQWITGFVDGEGCFHISILKQESMCLKKQVLPEFTVVQHERNIKVLYAFKSYFQCGVVRRNHGDRWSYRVRGHSNLSSIIVPFFEKHELKTTKRLDFVIFRDVVQMIGKGEHLTLQGLKTIEKCADRMNRKAIAQLQLS